MYAHFCTENRSLTISDLMIFCTVLDIKSFKYDWTNLPQIKAHPASSWHPPDKMPKKILEENQSPFMNLLD